MKRIIILFFLVSLLPGCARKPIYTSDTRDSIVYRDRVVYKDREQKDSVNTRDSVFVYVNGDTVYIYRDKLIYRDRMLRDTVSVKDTVYVELTQTHTEVRQVRHIPKFYKICFTLALLIVGFNIFKLVRRKRW